MTAISSASAPSAAPVEPAPTDRDVLSLVAAPEPAAHPGGRDRFEQPRAHPGMPRNPLFAPDVHLQTGHDAADARRARSGEAAHSGALCCVGSAACLLDTILCPVRCAVALAECALGCVQVIVCCPCIACAARAA